MDKVLHDWFLLNGTLTPSAMFPNSEETFHNVAYEVLRVIDGLPLFAEEHFERLRKTLQNRQDLVQINDFHALHKSLKVLSMANQAQEGNIKINVNQFEVLVYFIPHQYPDKETYANGVALSTFEFTRPDPHSKVFMQGYKQNVNAFIAQKGCFEALLINEHGHVTEGSKSNIFFTKNHQLYSPSSKDILLGITRQKIIYICGQLQIPVEEKNIALSELPEYEGAFLTGTSPKVLPIRQIDGVTYNPKHELIDQVADYYNKMIENYLNTKKL